MNNDFNHFLYVNVQMLQKVTLPRGPMDVEMNNRNSLHLGTRDGKRRVGDVFANNYSSSSLEFLIAINMSNATSGKVLGHFSHAVVHCVILLSNTKL